MSAVERVWLAAALALTVSATPLAQESKSGAVINELEAGLRQAMRIAVERVARIKRTAGGKSRALVNRCRRGVAFAEGARR